jgi:Tfp pilus assembly protein PilZ
MCGIAGIIHRDGNADVGSEMTRMLQAMKHRGPDSTGFALFGPESDFVVIRFKLADANDPRGFDFKERLDRHRQEVESRLHKIGASIDRVEREIVPFLKGGGIFIPTSRQYQLGEEVFMLLSLMDDPNRIAVQGKVVWITPEGVQGNRTQGIGVQFTQDDTGGAARATIEKILGESLASPRPTHTM